MNKILVEISCPAAGRHYDFWLAKKLTVENAIEKLVFEIKHYENNSSLFFNIRDVVLCSSTLGVLDRKVTLEKANVQSGDTLMLI
jgi:hypothetical protein